MSTPANIPVTSLKSLKSTIHTDPQVRRWFEFLVTHPAFKKKSAGDLRLRALYQKLSRLRAAEKIIITILFFLLFVTIWQPRPLLLIGILLLWPYFRIMTAKSDIVAEIILPVIKEDYPQGNLTFTSLYQITETYGQRYQIPTLIDTIYHLDRTVRWVIFAFLVTTCIILPLTLTQQIIYAVCAQVIVVQWLRTDFIYKRLK